MKALLAALAVALVLPAAPAAPNATAARAAQEQPGSKAELRLVSKTPWVATGGEFDMLVQPKAFGDPAATELSVSVFRQVTSRSEFQLTLEDRIRGSAINTPTVQRLSELTADAAGNYTIRLPIQDPALPVDRTRLRLREEGVYPVRVELRDVETRESIARITTHLVHANAPKDAGVPLGFSWVLPLSAPPALQPDGSRALDDASADRLAVIAQRLDAHPRVPLSLQPAPETLEALSDSAREADRDTLQTLVSVAKTRQVVSGTYVPVQPGAFTSAGDDEFAAQLDRGGDVLARLLGVRPDPRNWVAEDRLDDAAMERLRTQQVDRIVLPETALAPTNLSVTLAQPFDLQTRSPRRPTAAAADPALSSHFLPPGNRDDDPVLRGHALLAELAVVYFDRPGRPRGVVAQSPRNWGTDRRFLDVVLGGLELSPIVKGVTLDGLFSSVPKATGARNTTLARPLAANPAASPLPLDEIRDTRTQLDAFASMLDAENSLDDDLEEVLLTAQSLDLRARQRIQYLDGVERRIKQEVGRIEVPASRTITLTAREGEIPVTVQWTGDYPVQVRLRVNSDKLEFPGGNNSRVVTLDRRNTTERFVVEARTSGAFPLRISLESPQGRLVVAQARFTVRSTAASGVGIGLSVGAGAILLMWWARHLVRGRRNRKLVPA